MTDIFSENIQESFSKELPADSIEENIPRQVFDACFSYVNPKKPNNPQLIHISEDLLRDLGIRVDDKEHFTSVMSGASPFNGFKPYAMCYGGHQFGNWAGQLGDGRAINIAEVGIDGENWKFQLKGAGPTPFSRGSDGLAVLRSSVREYLCSEAMHNLRVPTTRALSLVKTGDYVMRDVLYDGNPAFEQGAIVCRVSQSFIRFGNFEIFSARNDIKNLRKLTDFTIKHHFPHLGEPSKEVYLKFFEEVVSSTKAMLIHWQRVGFVHGVMNTDNMSILGQTIDYGPYGWVENFDPDWTPNTTDRQNRRYRFGNQPTVGLWNLTQLANALYSLIEEVKPLQDILDGYKNGFQTEYTDMMREKIGLKTKEDADNQLLQNLETLLQSSSIDMTIFFRNLSEFENSKTFLPIIKEANYLNEGDFLNFGAQWEEWLNLYAARLDAENSSEQERKAKMNLVNPKYVLRNYMAQLAIDDAENGDYGLLNELYQLLQKPYAEQPEMQKWFAKRPDWAKHKVGCSMLSCSS
jgi:serine/tyrosine/threonine adenylyltransferase